MQSLLQHSLAEHSSNHPVYAIVHWQEQMHSKGWEDYNVTSFHTPPHMLSSEDLYLFLEDGCSHTRSASWLKIVLPNYAVHKIVMSPCCFWWCLCVVTWPEPRQHVLSKFVFTKEGNLEKEQGKALFLTSFITDDDVRSNTEPYDKFFLEKCLYLWSFIHIKPCMPHIQPNTQMWVTKGQV